MPHCYQQQPSRAEDSARLRGLLAAHRHITGDLSLSAVLNRIVDAACDLVGAQYGALGVVAADGSLEHFVHRGMDEPASALTALASGLAMLDAVLDRNEGVRVADLATDPAAAAFPPHLPRMTSFLGVPIRVRGQAFGALYLADPAPDRFDSDDEELVMSLAATAGRAIDNARLYDEARRSRDWLHASGEIARALLRDADNEVVPDVLERAFVVADADYAGIIVPAEDGLLRVSTVIGVGADDFRGMLFDPADSPLGKAVVVAESIRTHDLALWARIGFDNRHNFGPAMLVPLIANGGRGAMLMMRLADQPPFSAHEVEWASTFAAQVALAMELSEARAEAEQMRALEERHRIAQDLHDNVMQRLFATGLGLQAMAAEVRDPALAARLQQHIADLDETLDEIRRRIFGLRDDRRAAL